MCHPSLAETSSCQRLCRQHAFGHDEFHPQAETGSEWFGLGLTIIDSLDTLMIMGLTEEVAACRAWIAKDLKMDQVRVSVIMSST